MFSEAVKGVECLDCMCGANCRNRHTRSVSEQAGGLLLKNLCGVQNPPGEHEEFVSSGFTGVVFSHNAVLVCILSRCVAFSSFLVSVSQRHSAESA